MTGIVFGLCLSTASTVVLLRALEERQLIDSQRGQIAIGWLIVEDLVMVLTLVLPAGRYGGERQRRLRFLALDLGITIGKVVAFIAIMMLVGRRLVPWIMSQRGHRLARAVHPVGAGPGAASPSAPWSCLMSPSPSAPSLPAWCLTNPS
jgi:CPA2 family monovalent cation:H+ antiporter-2